MDTILSTHSLRFLDFLSYPDLEIARGHSTFFCGESGCGKSTLLKLFNATVSPSAGTIFYDGRDITTMDTVSLRKEVLLVSQTIFLFDNTIAENFKLYYDFRDEEPPSETEMAQFLSLCCADFPLTIDCNTLSGGERQRVFLAIHLSFLPNVLMLDEPTSALDEATAHRFFSGVKTFFNDLGKTLVVISHDNALAEQYADTLIRLKKGAYS